MYPIFFLHFLFYFLRFDTNLSKKLISKFLHFNQRVLYKVGFENDTKQKKSPRKPRFSGLIWREYVGIEPTREVPSPPHRF